VPLPSVPGGTRPFNTVGTAADRLDQNGLQPVDKLRQALRRLCPGPRQAAGAVVRWPASAQKTATWTAESASIEFHAGRIAGWKPAETIFWVSHASMVEFYAYLGVGPSRRVLLSAAGILNNRRSPPHARASRTERRQVGWLVCYGRYRFNGNRCERTRGNDPMCWR
jgi:hypothetical protein